MKLLRAAYLTANEHREFLTAPAIQTYKLLRNVARGEFASSVESLALKKKQPRDDLRVLTQFDLSPEENSSLLRLMPARSSRL